MPTPGENRCCANVPAGKMVSAQLTWEGLQHTLAVLLVLYLSYNPNAVGAHAHAAVLSGLAVQEAHRALSPGCGNRGGAITFLYFIYPSIYLITGL